MPLTIVLTSSPIFTFDFNNLSAFSTFSLSIIVPIYKVEKYIQQCIESILGQTFSNFEVLCVDDCGNDESINILKKYAEIDKRIKIFMPSKLKCG